MASAKETDLEHMTLSEARSRLYQRRFSRPNTHFAALKVFRDLQEYHLLASKFCKIFAKFLQKFTKFAREKMIFL